jgi:hypothetical protein
MTPRPPLLLVDNVFDTVTQYPFATLSSSSERTGHEAFRVADYRRERTSWQPTAAAVSHYVEADLGTGGDRTVDYLYLDRGHNLWGKTIQVRYGVAGATLHVSLAVPAIGTLGGDPTTGFAVTEEGACYALFDAPAAAHQVWRVVVVDNMAPILPGVMLGLRSQLLGYSRTFDEDAGERTQTSAVSTAGYQGSDTTYAWRTLDLDLATIGATEYDGTIRTLRRQLFERNQPVVVLMDYGTRPERGWLYQLDGKSWGFAKTRVLRSGRIRLREVGASLV